MEQDNIVNVYIPKHGTYPASNIAAGSGIVGWPTKADGSHITTVYFEGNVYCADNLHAFKDRVMVAAFRLRDRAPTIAVMRAPRDNFILAGQFDISAREFIPLNQGDIQTKLGEWINHYKHTPKNQDAEI